jgi:hypothetical protein
MATLVAGNSKLGRAYVPTSALAKLVEFDDELMHVYLTDGRVISVPIIWFPSLRNASPEQRAQYEIGGGGHGLHWPELDEDLSVAGLMAGVDWQAA